MNRDIILIRKYSENRQFEGIKMKQQSGLSMIMAVFCDWTPCSLVERYQLFREICSFYSTLKANDGGSYETTVNFYRIIQRHIPKDTTS
jgi:hypothetical protein